MVCASFSNGVFTVAGAGADIWGTADSFNFLSRPVSGDGQIVARVTALQNTGAYAKAGIMWREAPAAGSAHVILDVRPGGAVEFMTRSATGGPTTYIVGVLPQPFPIRLELRRTGSSVTGYFSNGSAGETLISK